MGSCISKPAREQDRHASSSQDPIEELAGAIRPKLDGKVRSISMVACASKCIVSYFPPHALLLHSWHASVMLLAMVSQTSSAPHVAVFEATSVSYHPKHRLQCLQCGCKDILTD